MSSPIAESVGATKVALQWADYICPFEVAHQIRDYSQEQIAEIASKPKSKRQIDFEMGRSCAKAALNVYGCEGPVGTDEDRAPIWPHGFVGSISHSDCRAWSAVARADVVRSIGVDTESMVDATSQILLMDEIATAPEWELANSTGLTPTQAFTLVFSAKESFYKVWSPITRKFFGFHHAVVTDLDSEKVTISMTSQNPNYTRQPESLPVYFFIDGNDVFTTAWMNHEDLN